MLAREKMSRRIHTVHSDELAQIAYARMLELKIRHLPVVEDGKMVGLLSDRDMLLYAKSGHGYSFPEGLRVEEIMEKNVVSASPDASLSRIATLMIDQKIDAIPIVQVDGQVVGLITSTDLLRLIAQAEFDGERFRPLSMGSASSYTWEICEDIV